MSLHYNRTYDHDTGTSYGVSLDRTPGYKTVLCVTLWRHQWVLEFGRGDSYDWD